MVSYISNEPYNHFYCIRKRGITLHGKLTEEKSIYLQIGEMIENDILKGILTEEEQAPSTNELAKFYNINPATAAKGLNMLVDEEILYKKRGIGMFVADGAKDIIIKKRKANFFDKYIRRMLEEAQDLEISHEELVNMIKEEKDN